MNRALALLATCSTACGPGIGNAEFARTATAEITNAALADDLRLLLDAGKAGLSRCGDPFRVRVRQGESGDVAMDLRVIGKPGQAVRIDPDVSSRFGPTYNLCAMSALSDTKVIASAYYNASVSLHWSIAPEKGPP